MNFKNLSEITATIKKWVAIRNNPEEIIQYLDTGTMFSFERKQDSTSNLHVYPGIHDQDGQKKMYIFLIAADDDKKEHSDDYLFNAITQCEVRHTGLNDIPEEISEEDAKKRINAWSKNYVNWIIAQILTPDGIFKAFNMPSSYIEKEKKYNTYFSLKEEKVLFSADLITVERSKQHIAFYDTVRPVPPFDFAPQNSFYLLNK